MPRPLCPLLRCCVAVALVALTCVANAQTASPRAEDALQKLKAADANGDGMLSREEAADMPRLSKAFDRIDANQDGLISREELRAAAKKLRADQR
jgi:Ca2+-binding EF-hand superfamily protein